MRNRFKFSLIFSLMTLTGFINADEREPKIATQQKGVTLTLIAKHPEIVTPTGVDVGKDGRVWAVSSHTHFPPEDYDGPKHDEILIFDKGKRSVFYNATHHTMDLVLGKDGWVYLAERSRIFRIKDSNSDGKADIEENLATLKTKAIYPHNGLAGLAWDINGDLIFCLGENFAKKWTLTGTDKIVHKGASEGGVFRIKPDGSGLKRITRGMWNPFGICVRENGELFAVDNDPGELPPCRLLQIVQGGDYGYLRKYGAESHHPFVCWNGELSGTLPMVHPVGEAPCGVVTFGQGLISPSWGDHNISYYPLAAKGAGYTTKPIELVKGSRYFRPTCITSNISETRKNVQSWYVTDWVDGSYNVHGYGRLWKLEINTDEAKWAGNLKLKPKTKEALLAEKLRSGTDSPSLNKLLEISLNKDPYLAQAAIYSLSLKADQWKIADVQNQTVQNQIQMLLAIRLASQERVPKIDLNQCVNYFLTIKNSDIQFETLHWISNLELKQFLPTVETILNQSNLEYKIFEAAIATWNTLNGKSENGIRNEEMLLKKVKDSSSSPKIRAFALRLLPARNTRATDNKTVGSTTFPKGLSLDLLNELLAVGDSELSLETIRTLSGNPKQGEKKLASIAADKQFPIDLRTEAIAGLAGTSLNHLDLLLKLTTSDQKEIREEALRSLRLIELTPKQKDRIKSIHKTYPESADLVAAIITPDSLSQNRPAFTDISGWNERLNSVPGIANIKSGQRLFHHKKVASCSSCHRHTGRGNTVGPDLSSVSTRNDRKWLLESILQPSLEMSPEFQPRTIVLVDGRIFTGIRLQSYTHEAIRDNKGEKRTFPKSDVEMIKDLDVSFMPTGLAHTMTDRELRDLVAFLATIKK